MADIIAPPSWKKTNNSYAQTPSWYSASLILCLEPVEFDARTTDAQMVQEKTDDMLQNTAQFVTSRGKSWKDAGVQLTAVL